MEIKGRFFQVSETSFFLFGPRGTGKSTWLHAHLQDALLVDLLAPETYRLYAARPERLGNSSLAILPRTPSSSTRCKSSPSYST